MMTKEGIDSVQHYCSETAKTMPFLENSESFFNVAGLLDKATPEDLYLLVDTGLYNNILIGYATVAAQISGLSPQDVKRLRAGMREAFEEFSAKVIDQKETERHG